MGKGLLGGGGGKKGIPTEGLVGSGLMPAIFAEAGMQHQRKYGTSFEQFAKVSVMTSDPYTDRNLEMADVNSCTQLAARQAYEVAGIGPEDIDLVELHDCFATAEILHYGLLGLCRPEEAGKRQVENARLGLTHVIGLGSACAIHILERVD